MFTVSATMFTHEHPHPTMNRGPAGTYLVTTTSGESVSAFMPNALPPVPALEFGDGRLQRLERANLALGRLDGVSGFLPDPDLFLYTYVRREAVLSSQIEGTKSTLSDLFLFELDEAPGVPLDDVIEVSNYVAALEHGMSRMRGGFPLCTRLIREVHEKLLSRGPGSAMKPGEFRRSQNWLGGTRPGNAIYVPPPWEHVEDAMSALEQYIHTTGQDLPLIVRAGLVHLQFETIHPFLDGNGRVGRLLIALMLHDAGVLRHPLLYLSLFLKQNRAQYYRLLGVVRQTGDWESWIDFFLEGVEQTANDAVTTARALLALFNEDTRRITSIDRPTASVLHVFAAFRMRPIAHLRDVEKRTGLSYPTVRRAVEVLQGAGILVEITAKKRDRVYSYPKYLAILNAGTEQV